MNLNQWAIKWGVSVEALQDLKLQMGIADITPPSPNGVTTEQGAQTQVRIAASKAGWRLWRNNVGVLKDDRGVPVRYGLCNDSSKLNKLIKSSDLIGINDRGQFVAREVKKPGWRYTGTERERAQLNFIELINAMGGDAKFTTGEL